MLLTPGTRFGTFEILSPVGAGGMGEVYRARDTNLGRDVAIKVLPRGLADDPERLARFQREARTLASLNHPAIAAIYGSEEAMLSLPAGNATVRGLVLEFVPGQTLAERIAASPGGIPLDEALTLARQMVDAIAAAHACGIIHRDLKPANIKVTPAGTVKVLDFGLAKAIAGETEPADMSLSPTITALATRGGVILGTAPYMSPEQARGKQLDRRADIWAFGCVLFEMITGHAAFARETVSDTLVAVIEREPDWSRLPEHSPPSLHRLLRRCLAKDPARRLHDIADAGLDLDEAASPLPEAGAAPGRRPARVALALALPGAIVGSAIAAGLIFLYGRPAPAERPRLERPLLVTNSPEQEFGPAVSPDGKWVAYYASAGGRTDLWVRFLDSGATANLTADYAFELPARTGIGGIAIPPDGSQIAFLVRKSAETYAYDTWVVPAPVGGNPRKLLDTLQAVQWSPDGRRLAAVRPGSTGGDTLVVADYDGSNPREIVPQSPGRHIHWPAWSADGEHVYFIHSFETWHSTAEIYRVPIAGGAPELVVPSSRRAAYPAPLPGGDLLFAADQDTVDLGLWLEHGGNGVIEPLTMGVGEYTEVRVSPDARKVVATLVNVQQSLMELPLADAASGLVPLTRGHTGDIDPSVHAGTDRLVFSSSRSGRRNLWIAKSDASDARPLTTESVVDERPAFSPDGSQIAFVSNRSGRQGIWVMNTSGGAPKLLAETLVLDSLTWARDGSRVLFARVDSDSTGLASVAVASGQIESVSAPGPACCPAASPVADMVAYLQPTMIDAEGPSGSPESRLWLRFVDFRGQRLFEQLPDQSFANGQLAWSHDGTRLVGASITATGASSLWLIDPQDAQPYRKLLDFSAIGRPRGLTWTSDMSRIILGNQEFPGDIVLFDLVR